MKSHYSEGLKPRKGYELEEILEGLVDRHGIDDVILMLGGVCEGKFNHSKYVWQDPKEAKHWQDRCNKLWSI